MVEILCGIVDVFIKADHWGLQKLLCHILESTCSNLDVAIFIARAHASRLDHSRLSCAIYEKYFTDSNGLFIFKLVCLAMTSFYFVLREVLQILSLWKKGLQSEWFGDGKNALDALNIVMGFAWVGIFSICKQSN
mmetsp:Transcript_30464/g.46023  ORF Transcript_30464/g.46023 Transcript_30464/m.46023 type:complete len:135 (-) Transcript_30464:136-540(-)